MPLDLYTDKPAGVAKEVVGQQFQTGQRFASSLFSRGTAMGAYKSKAEYNKARIGEAIDAWGLDLVSDWSKNSEQLMTAVSDDLEEMRRQASMAREANDLEQYKLALQRIMFDKQMKAYGDALNKARIGDIFTSIVAGLGQIAAGYFSSEEWLNRDQWTTRFEGYRPYPGYQ